MGINEIKDRVGGLFGKRKKLNEFEIQQRKEFLEREKIRLNKLKEMKNVENEVAQLNSDLAQTDYEIEKANQKRIAMAPRHSSGLTLFNK